MNATKRFLEEVAENIGIPISDISNPRVIQAASEILRELGEKSVLGEPLIVRGRYGKIYEISGDLSGAIAPVNEQ